MRNKTINYVTYATNVGLNLSFDIELYESPLMRVQKSDIRAQKKVA